MPVNLFTCSKFFLCKTAYLKRILVTAFCIFLLTHASFPQRTKIDSLHKILAALHDTARINCLNKLSACYCNSNKSIPHYARTDSAELCAKEAYLKAVTLNYKQGIAGAVLNLGELYAARFNFFTAQKYFEQAVALFKEVKNEPGYIHAYMSWLGVFFYTCDYHAIRTKIQIPLQYYTNIHDTLAEADILGYLWECDTWEGHAEKAFESLQTDFNLRKNLTAPANVLYVLYRKEQLYREAEWLDSAASYAVKIIAYKKKMGLDTVATGDNGFKYFMQGKWDSAQYYNKQVHTLIMSYKGIDSIVKERMILRNDIDIASLDQRLGKYQDALSIFMKALQYDKQNNIIIEELEVLLNISQTYKLQAKANDAIHYLQNLLSLAQKTGASYYIQKAYEELCNIYGNKKDSAIAYKYYLKYTELKDSAVTGSYQRKLAIINELTNEQEQQLKIAALNEDNKIKQDAIQKNVLIRNILIGGIAALFLVAFIIYRIIALKRKNEKHLLELAENELQIQKLESEKKETQLKHQASELELQALRAQMNPHFIFNCLNSINRFIINSDEKKAADYLTKFAKLIRIVLEQSGKSFVPLEDELKCLQLYMDLEALRFEMPFQYSINCNGTDTSCVMIHTLLIQPFVENAIWHGLESNGIYKGRINIDIHVQDKILHCTICDNGVGRTANLAKQKDGLQKKSLGISITQHRLQLIDASVQNASGVEIQDILNKEGRSSGTCVHIKIPVKEI